MATWRQRLAARIAGAPEHKQANPVMAAIIQSGPYSARWMDVNYENVARDGFGRNPYVYAAIRQIAETLAGIPWQLYTDSDKKTKIEHHPLLDLINRPNERMGRSKFFETLSAYLDLDGNVFIYAIGPDGKPPKELWPLRPDRVEINLSKNPAAPIAGYTYRAGVASVKIEDPKLVRHISLFNPLDDFRGMSPMSAAAMATVQSNWSKQWNVSSLQHGMAPSGAWISPTELTVEQYTRLKSQTIEEYSGFTNAGRSILVEGGTTWQQMGMNAVDMAWVEGQRLSAREIAIVYGIAPELIGDSTNKTYSNYGEARKALYQEKALPRLDNFKDELNVWLVPLYKEPLYLDYDKDEIEALQEDRNALSTRVTSQFQAGFVTVNEARKETGYNEDKGEWGDKYIFELPQRAAAAPEGGAGAAGIAAGPNMLGLPEGAGGADGAGNARGRTRVTEEGGGQTERAAEGGAPRALPAPSGAEGGKPAAGANAGSAGGEAGQKFVSLRQVVDATPY